MPKPEVVFFDAGGTLFRPYPSVGAVYARVAARHGVQVDAVKVEKAFHEKWHERNGMTTLAGLSSEKIEREWWHRMVRDVFADHSAFPSGTLLMSSPAATGEASIESLRTGNEGTPFGDFDAFFRELYDLFARAECWRLFDDTRPVLERLKAEGFRLAIISNWDHRLFSIVKQLGLADYFEQVTASSAVGTAKPGKRIFEAALEAMRITAADGLHVGDSLEDDYHGASRAGLRAVLLARHEPLLPSRAEQSQYNGIVKISNLHELPDLIA